MPGSYERGEESPDSTDQLSDYQLLIGLLREVTDSRFFGQQVGMCVVSP
jgi:hypothetical protein